MIAYVLHGTLVLGATFPCQEWSSKGIWTLTYYILLLSIYVLQYAIFMVA